MVHKLFIALYIVSLWGVTFQNVASPRERKNIGPRIIGGLPAAETEFPFMAAIWSTTNLGRYFCGGAVIDRQWILTAGHCVENAVSFSIQLGSIKLSGTDSNRLTLTATTSVLHPDFDSETLVNNVGLIYLNEALRYNDYVNVIPLPTAPLNSDTLSVSVGWGQTDDDHSGPVNDLQRVYVITFSNDHCQNIYGTQIVDSMVCAMGSYNEGTCIGDIGSPLVVGEGIDAVHGGIASFLSGNGCESLDPSGYERTFHYLEWIRNVTNIA